MKPHEKDLFSLYFELTKDTESPQLFHRWACISIVSSLLGRQSWVPFGAFRIFPNQYIMLIGEAGSRKSVAIKYSKKLLARAGYNTFSAEKTTKEKFLLDLEGMEDQDNKELTNDAVMQNLFGQDIGSMEPKEVYIVADEFNDFMRCGDMEFHSMLGALWDYDDETGQYKQRLKNSKSIAIYQPTINLFGGNTHEGFAEMFPPQAIGQGFLSRMLLIFSEPSGRKIAWPEKPSQEKEALFIQRLQEIKTLMNGPLLLSVKAKEVLTILYNTYEGFTDVRFTSYFTRRYTHLIKLCIVCAAARGKQLIDVQEVMLANTILAYTEHFMPKALGEFGKAKNADVANKILGVLQKSFKPVDVPEIWKQVSSDLNGQEELAKLMAGLQTAGKVQWIKRTAAGVQGYMIVRKQLGNKALYVDWNLLPEYKQVGIN
jgi:hypothetical protein